MFNLESEVGSPVELPAMMGKFEIVLLAACRATRQIPEDHLDWDHQKGSVPGSLRPDRALNAYSL